jgi:organic radical activating enzyme
MITEINNTQPKDLLDVRWALSNVCNYKCVYCFPGSNEGDYKFPKNTSLVIKNFNQIFDHYTRHAGKKKFHLRLLGGEPTLWPELDYFIKRVKENHDVYVSVITNGSRTLRWWQDNGDLIDNVTISYHRKFADLNHIIDVADTVYMLGKKVTVHVLMDPLDWEGCVSDIEVMKRRSKYPWIIQTKKITPTSRYSVSYTKEQNKFMSLEIKRFPSVLWLLKQFKLILNGTIRLYESKYIKDGKSFKASAETYIVNNDVDFKGYSCNMGIESIYIDWDGRIASSCGQSLFGNMYNILNDLNNFSPKFEPVICQQVMCFCPTENHVSKKYIKIVSS